MLKTYVFRVQMRREFHDIDDLVCSHGAPVRTGLFDMIWKVALDCLLVRLVVDTDDGCVEVEIGLDGNGIADVLGKPIFLREKHKCAGQGSIQLAVPVPELAVLKVLGAVRRLVALNVSHDLIEDVTGNDGGGEGRVGCSLKYLGEGARFLFLALLKRLFRAG